MALCECLYPDAGIDQHTPASRGRIEDMPTGYRTTETQHTTMNLRIIIIIIDFDSHVSKQPAKGLITNHVTHHYIIGSSL